jgi:hypothetical protein
MAFVAGHSMHLMDRSRKVVGLCRHEAFLRQLIMAMDAGIFRFFGISGRCRRGPDNSGAQDKGTKDDTIKR